MFIKLIAKSEAFFKGVMFDCHSCGQCILKKTGLICPMSCPKGLRNGPCGGTTEEKCEVYPDKSCVWIRIRKRTTGRSTDCPTLFSSPDASLYHTSSYLNLLTGKSKDTQRALAYLDLGNEKKRLPLQTKSKLEEKFKADNFVFTTELRCPREADFSHFHQEAALLKGHFDAVNATAFLNGNPSLPSPRMAAELVSLGISPIAQSTCRDHTKTSFVAELMLNQMNGVHNVLCLTGDSYMGTPKIKQVFDMDSSLMLYEARFIREKGRIHFNGIELKKPPKLFLGTAINPFSDPENVPIIRLKQKSAAGADFVQTQAVFDFLKFKKFMENFVSENMDKELYMLAGIPVLTSKGALGMIPHIPGIYFPAAVRERFEKSTDLRREGIEFAKELIEKVRTLPGISGVHLMLFGSDHSVLPGIVNNGMNRT